jgi:serine/threonine-protein kinase
VVGAAGVAGIGVGTYFGWKASSDWSNAKAGCTRFPTGCSETSVNQGTDARSSGNLSTVAFAIGAAGIAGAIVLWVTAPKPTSTEPQVALVAWPGGASLRGAF